MFLAHPCNKQKRWSDNYAIEERKPDHYDWGDRERHRCSLLLYAGARISPKCSGSRIPDRLSRLRAIARDRYLLRVNSIWVVD